MTRRFHHLPTTKTMSYSDDRVPVGAISAILMFLFILIGFGMYGCPKYNVWQSGLAGEAELRKAEQNRQITVQEALAKLESAKSLAAAEIERAKGVAEANRIIAEGLGGPEGYLRWLWVDALSSKTGDREIVYIPTEAGMPLLEARNR